MKNLKSTMPAPRLVCRADIELDALEHNLQVLSLASKPAQVICMVKANAYGHGATIVAAHLEKLGVKWFGVATVDEAIELRNAGLKSRILVMSGSGAHFSASELITYRLTPVLSSLDEVEAIISALRERKTEVSFPVHIELDTGMSRGGFLSLDAPEIFLRHSELLLLEGVATHFAKAEEANCEFSRVQCQRFLENIRKIMHVGSGPTYIHVDKSASILSQVSRQLIQELRGLSSSFVFLSRPGVALYGIDSTKEGDFAKNLRPVLSWRAPIVLRKTLPSGTPIGYDSTFVTNRTTEMALVRVGYADGLKRMLSNRGSMVIDGMRVPIVGRISMDLSAVDVSDVVAQRGASVCEVGSFASIICSDGDNAQSVYDLAKACDTIPYEILTSISARVQRFPL